MPTRLMTICTVQIRQQSGCCTQIESHSPFAQRTTNAMHDNTSGVVPLATAACLAVSAVSFILGFDQRRRRRTATTLQDEDFVMMPQLAAGKHEVGPAREWRHYAIYHIAGCLRSALPNLDHSWGVANRSWNWTFAPCC